MADTFTKDRLAWLEQVQDDRNVSASAFSVAFAVARHLNRRTGNAFPGREALAAMTGISVRQVSEHIQALRDRGHLALQRRRNQSTLYRPVMPQDVRQTAHPVVRKTAGPDEQDVRKTAPRMCGKPHIGMCGQPQPNPLKEPIEEEPFEGERDDGDLFSGSPEPRRAIAAVVTAKTTRRKGPFLVPTDWQPPDDAYEFGASLGLTSERVERETAKFRDYEFAKPWTDWNRTWRNWMRGAAGPRSGSRNAPRQSASDMAAEALEIFR